MTEGRNWFDQGGRAYAKHRPDYPDDLARYLAGIAPDTRLALDVGCGSGQFTAQLAGCFEMVVGTDPSEDQIAHARSGDNIRYRVAAAEALGGADGSASLITAAQAAHWFDLPRFYREARRLGKPGACLALVSYGVAVLDDRVNERFQEFYRHDVGPYWPPERRLVDTGYADIDFPFREISYPQMAIVRQWSGYDFLGYVATWSATRRAREAGHSRLLAEFGDDLFDFWGDPKQTRTVTWPINMRLGIIEP